MNGATFGFSFILVAVERQQLLDLTGGEKPRPVSLAPME
jgi:hypothetical protein